MWAFDQDFTNLDPDTSITYPEGFENSGFKRLWANESTINPDTGKNNSYQIDDWLPFLRETLHNIPYQISYEQADENYCFVAEAEIDRNLEHISGHNEFLYLTNGEKSQARNMGYKGGLYAWFNKIYVKETYSTDGNSRRVIFSDGPVDSNFYPIGFINSDGEELEGVWLPMGYRPNSNNVHSNSYCALKWDGNANTYVNIFPINSTGVPSQYSPSASVGDYVYEHSLEMATLGGGLMNVIRDLLYMMCKTTNIQESCGYNGSLGGVTVTPVTAAPSGTAAQLYGFYGERKKGESSSNQQANSNRGWCIFYSQPLASYLKGLVDRYMFLGSDGYLRYCPKYAKNAIVKTTTTININEDVYVKSNIHNDDIIAGSGSRSGWMDKLAHVSKEFGSIPIRSNRNGSGDTGLCDINSIYNDENTFATRWCNGPNDATNAGPGQLRYQRGISVDNNADVQLFEVQLLLPPVGYKPYTN